MDSARRIHLPGEVANRKSLFFIANRVNTSYYQCLYDLDNLFAKGLKRLVAGQSRSYYELCRKAEDLSTVEAGRKASDYKRDFKAGSWSSS